MSDEYVSVAEHVINFKPFINICINRCLYQINW